MSHPGQALLEAERARNRILRQVRLGERVRALLLERELRFIQQQQRHEHSRA